MTLIKGFHSKLFSRPFLVDQKNDGVSTFLLLPCFNSVSVPQFLCLHSLFCRRFVSNPPLFIYTLDSFLCPLLSFVCHSPSGVTLCRRLLQTSMKRQWWSFLLGRCLRLSFFRIDGHHKPTSCVYYESYGRSLIRYRRGQGGRVTLCTVTS